MHIGRLIFHPVYQMNIHVRKINRKHQIWSARSILSIKCLLPSEGFIYFNQRGKSSCRDHLQNYHGNQQSSNLFQPYFYQTKVPLGKGLQYFSCMKWEVIMHGHVCIRKTGNVQDGLPLSWPLCNILTRLIYVIVSSPLYPEAWKCKNYIQSSSGDLACSVECSCIGVRLSEVAFSSSWSACDDVLDESSENLVTTERCRSCQNTFFLQEIANLRLNSWNFSKVNAKLRQSLQQHCYYKPTKLE